MFEVVLVRHALPVPPSAGGPDDFARPLCAEGFRQARALAGVLGRPAAVWSSPYLRAVQTVEPAAAACGLPVRTRHDLREWDDGLPFLDDWLPAYERSWADPALAWPGGESLRDLSRRAVAAVRSVAVAGAGVVVGSHGMFASMALLGFGAPVGWSFWRAMPMPAVYRLRFSDAAARPAMSGPGL